MARYESNTFVGQRIQVDGHQFVGNRFENCVLVYAGGPLVMTHNLLQNVQWQFVDSAARTLYLLSTFYQSGGTSRQFVEFLLTTFGKPVETSPPASPAEGVTEDAEAEQTEPQRIEQRMGPMR